MPGSAMKCVSALIIICMSLGSTCAGFFTKKSVLVRSVQYKECPGFNGYIVLRNARVSSSEQGDLIVSGDVSTAINMSAPIQAEVSASRHVLGAWVPLPCIMNVGSCTYPDLCKYGLSPEDRCPGALDENDVPCRCPISQGVYVLPGAQFPIPTTRLAGLLAGNYKATVKISSESRLLACYVLSVELQ